MSNFIKVGKLLTPYGILGWIHIQSFTQIHTKIFNYTPWCIIQNSQVHYIKSFIGKKNKKKLLVKFNNINNRNEANYFNNTNVMIHENQLPILPPSEYYWKDIINCNVQNIYKEKIGIVNNIINTGSNDILIIKHHNTISKKKILIPFIMNDVIKKINLAKKVITVKWMI